MKPKQEISRTVSKSLFETAKTLFPGGVNSPVRAFKSVGGTPIFMASGQGATLTDEDNNTFIDFCCSWGPLILGHAPAKVRKAINQTVERGTTFGAPTRLENELANLIISNNPFIEKLRFTSSGTEAVMSAIRLARGATGRDKIVKFEGCYHGHTDTLLVKAGSGLATFGVSSSAGVPESVAKDTIVLPLNDLPLLQKTLEAQKDEIAAVIIEPIPANNGLLLQDLTFLKQLRQYCTDYNILLIFDEVISGFRVGFTGAAGMFNIQPDILTYGKIIGGGLPVGAYGASSDLMSNISPEGAVYQAGTLSGNPVAMAAGIATLTELLKPNFYEQLASRTHKLSSIVERHAKREGYAFRMPHIGSIFWPQFDGLTIRRADQIKPDRMTRFASWHAALLQRGVYLGPSGYEVGFVSAAHKPSHMQHATKAFCDALDEVLGGD
jgi:glutamate-1-semialdehyde 2,1-aminomutase